MSEPTPPPQIQISPDAAMLIGQIHGIVQGLRDGQQQLRESNQALEEKLVSRMDGLDARLRTVEQRGAVFGAVSGGAMGIGMALLVDGLKVWLKRGGG